MSIYTTKFFLWSTVEVIYYQLLESRNIGMEKAALGQFDLNLLLLIRGQVAGAAA